MSLKIINPQNKLHYFKLIAFKNYITENAEIIDDYLNLINEKNSNRINQLVAQLKDDEIYELCIINGTKDNKFFELTPFSIHGKASQKFINETTSYAFQEFDAETITIFSNSPTDKTLLNEGFQSLGSYNDRFTYIKDKEETSKLGFVVK